MQILTLTIILISLILLGIIIGIYLNSKISEVHSHIEHVRSESRIQIAILDTKMSEIERGMHDTRKDIKAISEREEITDPGIRWGK